ncbi:MAG: hypothetical protein ABI406_01460 [Ktedonobacteraceae bacterium]
MREMVTSGKLPAIVSNQRFAPMPPVQPLPVIRSAAMPFAQQADRVTQQSVPVLSAVQQQSASVMTVRAEQLALQPTAPILPVKSEPQSEPSRNTRPLFASIYHQATIHVWDEVPRTTTDDLPTSGKNGKKVIESMLVPLPARPVTRNLWTYSEKLPAIPARKTDSVEHEKMGEVKGESKGPINFLL